MSEYAIFQSRPVRVGQHLQVVVRDQKGHDTGQRGAYLGTEVELPFGHKVYAQATDLEPINKQEYDRLVKEEKAESERLSKKEGFTAPEVFWNTGGGTGAQSDRSRR